MDQHEIITIAICLDTKEEAILCIADSPGFLASREFGFAHLKAHRSANDAPSLISKSFPGGNTNSLKPSFGLSKLDLDGSSIFVVSDVAGGLGGVVGSDVFKLCPLCTFFSILAKFIKTLYLRDVNVVPIGIVVSVIKQTQAWLSLLVAKNISPVLAFFLLVDDNWKLTF